MRADLLKRASYAQLMEIVKARQAAAIGTATNDVAIPDANSGMFTARRKGEARIRELQIKLRRDTDSLIRIYTEVADLAECEEMRSKERLDEYYEKLVAQIHYRVGVIRDYTKYETKLQGDESGMADEEYYAAMGEPIQYLATKIDVLRAEGAIFATKEGRSPVIVSNKEPSAGTLPERMDAHVAREGISHEELAARIKIPRSTYFEVKARRGSNRSKRKVETYISNNDN